MRTGGGCTQDQNPGYWFAIGTVDVNSASIPAPTISATRPQTNGNTTITVDPPADPDGGGPQIIQYDLDENTGNGVSGFEQDTIAAEGATITANQTRTINTTGQSPGLHTVRARVIDNGAMDAADNIRRTSSISTTTYLVNSPPTANGQSVVAETGTGKAITLSGTDGNGDSLTYSIVTGPSNGTLSGAGANQTYTSNAGFAGTDSFVFQVNDGFGGTSNATVNVTVEPNTVINSAPSGTINSRGGQVTFSSDATGATFECRIDAGAFASCTSPYDFTDLADGSHTVQVRATAGGQTDSTPASATFTVNASPSVSITSGPTGTINSPNATFTFTATEAGITVPLTVECQVDGGGYAPCTSPQSYSGLSDGSHTFDVRATDAYGKTDTDSQTFTVDTIAPDTVINSGPSGANGATSDPTNDPTPDFTFSSPDGTATFQCSVDGGAYAACVSPFTTPILSEGSHTFDVRAIDPAGNIDQSPASETFVVDLTNPETTIDTGPTEGQIVATTTPTFTFSSDESGSTFECSVDNAAFTACTSPYTTPSLAAGLHNFRVRAIDPAGNADGSPAERNFEVDLGAPETTIDTGPADGGTTADNTPTFTFSADDPNATFECSVDGAAYATCTSPFTTGTLSDGSHTFAVRATDQAGNTDATPAARTFTVDTTGPDTAIDTGPADLINQASATYTFSSPESGVSFECALDSAMYVPCTSPETYSGLSEGLHNFAVRAIDAVGNPDPTPAMDSFTVDTVPPNTTIDTGPTSPTADNTPTFTFSSNEAGSTFQCRLDGATFTSCSSPFTTATLADGPHTFDVRAIDPAGNTDPSAASQSFTVDTTGSETTILTGPPALTNQTTANFTYTSDEAPLVTYECSLDNAAFSLCLPTGQNYTGLAEGQHNFRVRSVDVLQNPDPTPASYTWTIDTTPPNTTIDSGPSGPVANSTPTFTFSSNEMGSSFQCRVDTATFTSCSTPFTTASLPDGPHTFEVRAIDPAGNTDASPASRSFTVDTTGPETTIDFGPTGTTPNAFPTFTFSASEANSTFQCKIDSGAFFSCTSPYQTPQLADGPHTFQVYGIDPLGNADPTPASRTFTVDATGPDTTINSGPSGPTNSATAAFTFSADEGGATFQCSLDSAAFTSCTSPQTYTGLSEGQHTFRVRAVDGAGNVDPSPASRTFTVDVTAPNTTINTGPTGPTADNTPVFTFSSSETGSTFECRIDAAAFASCTSPFLSSTLSDGPHTFEVRATDAAGNTDQSPASRSFTVDTTAPDTSIDSGPTGPVATTTPTFTFSSPDSGATFQCRVDNENFASCSSPFTTAPLSQGQHAFQVRAIDSVGNVDQSPALRNFSVDTIGPDTTIDSGPSGLTNNGSPSFTFSADELNVSFECSLDNAPFTVCSSPKSYPGLAQGPHNVRVRALDSLGNPDATPAQRSFTVDTIAPDTTINTGPTGPTADNTPDFTFSSTEGSSTFECRFDSGAFTSCSSPFTAPTLADGQHTLEVRATDPAGNTDQSPASRTFTVDTQAPDTTIDSGPAGPTADNTPTYTFSSPDNTATFQCRVDTAAFASCSSPFTTSALSDGPHTFEVRAVDPAGNTDQTPASSSIVVDTTAPQTTIDSGPTGPTTDTTPSFEFSSSEANSTFECRVDTASFSNCTSPFTSSELADGPHTFQVRATDALGNLDQSPASRSFSVDTTGPDTTITANPPALSNSASASFSFTGNETPVTFECSLDNAPFTVCSSPQTYAGLSDGQHNFRVRALDALGNPDPTPASYDWAIDTVAPQTTINFGPQGTTSNTTPTFGFSSSQANSTFECRVDSAVFTLCTSPKQVTPALSAGPHTFQVRAIDPSGNTDPTPASRSFTVDVNGPSSQIDSGPNGLTNDPTPTFTFSSSKPNSTFECRVDGGSFTLCSSPFTTGTLSEGPHSFDVRAIDSAGNTETGFSSATFTVDTVAPDTSIDSAPSGSITTDDVSVAFSSADGTATFECSLDGGAFTLCSSPKGYNDLGQGSHTVSVRATDGAGNIDQTPATATFTVDTVAPNTNILTGPTGLTNDATPTFTFDSDEAGSTFECRFDSDPFTNCSSPFTPGTALSDGAHTFEVRATDTAGTTDATPAGQSFTVDATAPAAPTLDAPTVTGNSATLTFSSAESGVTFECRIDGGTFELCVSPKTYSGLSVGSHTVDVRAVDSAGNAGAASSRTFSVSPTTPPDTTAPETTITAGPAEGSSTTDTAPSLSFASSEAGSTFECSLDGSAFSACTSPAALGTLAPGSHTFRVRATDASSNTDATPASRAWTITSTQAPAVAPKIFPKTRQLRVPRGGRVIVASLSCPQGTCTVSAPARATVKIAGVSYGARVKVSKGIRQGGKVKIKLILTRAAMQALGEAPRGRGKVKVTVSSSNGESVSKTVTYDLKLLKK